MPGAGLPTLRIWLRRTLETSDLFQTQLVSHAIYLSPSSIDRKDIPLIAAVKGLSLTD
jgi:hypothetical protein